VIPLIQGRTAESRQLAQRYRAEKRATILRADSFRNSCDYLAGVLPEDAYLKSAGRSRIDATNAHFFIGLTKLGERDRRGALEHFRAAERSGCYRGEHWYLCWLLAARLARDPEWPR
jgi:hypothetical protein